jgi:hypothetical protein
MMTRARGPCAMRVFGGPRSYATRLNSLSVERPPFRLGQFEERRNISAMVRVTNSGRSRVQP